MKFVRCRDCRAHIAVERIRWMKATSRDEECVYLIEDGAKDGCQHIISEYHAMELLFPSPVIVHGIIPAQPGYTLLVLWDDEPTPRRYTVIGWKLIRDGDGFDINVPVADSNDGDSESFTLLFPDGRVEERDTESGTCFYATEEEWLAMRLLKRSKEEADRAEKEKAA